MKAARRSRSLRRGRILPALVAALMVLLVVGPFATTSAVAQTCPGQITQDGNWEHIKAPSFRAGPQRITDFGVNQFSDSVLLITNGVAVMRSTDRGCSWKEVFSLADLPGGGQFGYSSTDSKIVEIAASPSPPGFPVAIFLGITQFDPVSKPHVVMSVDNGATWRAADAGLEAALGQPVQMAVAIPNVYLLVSAESSLTDLDIGFEAREQLYVSRNAGQSWDQGVGFAGGGSAGVGGQGLTISNGVDGLTVDYRAPNVVWLFGRGGVYRSNDGGNTAAPVGAIPAGVGAMNAFRDVLDGSPTAPGRVLAARESEATLHRSLDSGQTWTQVGAPGVVGSIAPALIAQEYVVSSNNGVHLMPPGAGPPVDVSPPDRRAVLDIVSVLNVGLGITPSSVFLELPLYGRTDNTLERTKIQANLQQPTPGGGPLPQELVGDIPPYDPDEELPGTLLPKNLALTLKQGQTRTVAYNLNLPESPTPLDVFFLIDISGSMGGTINGIRRAMADIATDLTNAGIDTYFGVGEYRSYNDDPAYRRVRDIGPPNQGLSDALNSLIARGGGFETQLEALLQSATGVGKNFEAFIEPGQQANFRPGTVRVIINSTDEPFSTGGSHPTYQQVADALRSKAARQVGIAVQDNLTNLQDPVDETARDGLVRVARDSGAYALEDGVDCTGDGNPDLAFGDPLVCVVDPARSSNASVMAPAIVNMLKNVVDFGSYTFEPRRRLNGSTVGGRVVKSFTPSTISSVNFKEPHHQQFAVTFKCPRVTEEQVFPVELLVAREAGSLALARASVTCVPEKEPATPAPILPFLLVAPIVPPPPPPRPVAPNPNPNPQPQTNPQAQAQAAMAAQRQEQTQLAYAATTREEEEAAGERIVVHQMSRYQPRTQAPAPDFIFSVSALSITFLFGCAWVMRDRYRTRTAHARRYNPYD